MKLKSANRGISLAITAVAILGFSIPSAGADASQISLRKLTLIAGATDQSSKPGGIVKHQFDFTVTNTGGGNIGSIAYQYCTLAAGTCVLPTGLVTTATTLDNQTGATGFTLVNTTNGTPYLSRVSAPIASPSTLSYRLANVTNPTSTNSTFFVRIKTFASIDTTGAIIDSGVVAASTATQIVLTGIMPESLVFCTGGTVGLTGGVPDCLTATSGAVSFDRLFSPTDTAIANSQMAASTNAGSGYVVSVFGNTLQSGANNISAMNTVATGIRGKSQFGLNFKANTLATSTPAVGTEVAPASTGTNYRGESLAGYNTVDNFKFTSGDTIVDSASGGAGGSDAQIYTASYIVNVPGSQPAGTYTTTLTYLCTPSF